MAEIIEANELSSTMFKWSPYTAFIPTNEALRGFIESNGVTLKQFIESQGDDTFIRAHLSTY